MYILRVFLIIVFFAGIRLGTDDMLRASYTPSPGRSRSSLTPTPSKFKSFTPTPKKFVKTPSGGSKKTPSIKKSKTGTPIAGSSGSTVKNQGDITDNLLNLPRRNVPTAEKIDLNTDNLLNISGGGKRQRTQEFFKP